MGRAVRLKIALSDDVEQYISLKKTYSTQATYRTAYQQFLIYYRKKHGERATILDFVEAVYDDLDKPLRERKRLAEIALSGYVKVFLSIQERRSLMLSGGLETHKFIVGVRVDNRSLM